MRARRVFSIAIALLLIAAVAVACGKKDRLLPRDQPDPEDERIPANWERTPAPGAALGIDGLLEDAGEAAQIKEQNATPTPEPTPTEADDDNDDSPDEDQP